MKKVIFITLLLFSLASANAQIQRQFLGCYLGQDNITSVCNKIDRMGYERNTNYDSNPSLVSISVFPTSNRSIMIGGQSWTCAIFFFYHSTLYKVLFAKGPWGSTYDEMDHKIGIIINQLESKYSAYIIPGSEEDLFLAMDRRTLCSVNKDSVDGKLGYFLEYTDIALIQAAQREASGDL